MRPSKESIILVSVPLFLYLHLQYVAEYYTIFLVATAFSLFCLPLALLVFMGEDLRKFGFIWKKWPFSLQTTVLTGLAITLFLYLVSSLPQFQEYYLLRKPEGIEFSIPYLFIYLAAYFFVWEFFFRGFLLFGLQERFGAFAIVIQAVPFAIMHFDKPPLEAVLAVFAGLLFGHIAYRSQSFLPTFLLHWLMNIALLTFV